MSKVKKIYKNWCSKEQYNCLAKYSKFMSSDIQFYKLSSNVVFFKSLKPNEQFANNSIELFDSFTKTKDFKFIFLHKIRKTLYSIRKDDVVFHLKGENYLFHTFKIITFISESVKAYLLSKDKVFVKGTIAEYSDREKDYYLSEYLDNREQFCKPNNLFKGANLINAFIYRNLYLHKDFTKYFLSFYSLIGVDNIKLINNSRFESKILKNTLKVFQSGKVDKKDCAKSLLSVLYYYLIFKMKINKNKALQVAKELVYDVFNIYYEYKGSEIIKNVYVLEVIGSHIVYSFDTKKEHITCKNKEFLENIVISSAMNINKFPTQFLKPSLDNPLRLYSLLTSSELLQKI